MDVQRTWLRNAARRRWLLQIDVERRDCLAVLAPAERLRHCGKIARKPQPLFDIRRWREETGAFRKADITDKIGCLTGDKACHRTILLRPVLHRILHEACIDRDHVAALQTCRHESPCAWPGNIVPDGRSRAEDHGVRSGAISRLEMNPAEFVPLRRELVPLR